METKFNILIIFAIFSLFLFASSLKIKESSGLESNTIEMDSEKEANNELKFGMAQDWDKESISEIQLEDFFTDISDNNSKFLEVPKNQKKDTVNEKNSEDSSII